MRSAFSHLSTIAFAAADLGSSPGTNLFGEVDPVELTRWTGDGGPSYDTDAMPQQAQQQQSFASQLSFFEPASEPDAIMVMDDEGPFPVRMRMTSREIDEHIQKYGSQPDAVL
jgi:hypothetical protein